MKRMAILLWLALCLVAPGQSTEPEAIPLWANGAPGALGTEPKDVPSLQVYLAPESGKPRAAMVILPGGGYGGLAGHEGKDYAIWLNKLGISGFVVKYRLGSHGYRHPSMLQDAARATRLVRSRASEWKIDPRRVGIMGSSAGGHLASTLLTHFDHGDSKAANPVDQQSSRPTLGILCYPVISMGPETHQGSKKNLLGDQPSEELVWNLSNERQVRPDTPPTFLWHTAEDKVVTVANSLMFAEALGRAGVPYALHVYPKGRHGLGLDNGHAWTLECAGWLKDQGFTE